MWKAEFLDTPCLKYLRGVNRRADVYLLDVTLGSCGWCAATCRAGGGSAGGVRSTGSDDADQCDDGSLGGLHEDEPET